MIYRWVGRAALGLGTHLTRSALFVVGTAAILSTSMPSLSFADDGQATPGSGPVQVPPVTVLGTPFTFDQQLQTEGTAAQGYRVDTLSAVGPLPGAAVQDTPFSIGVIPQALIQNLQAASVDDLFRVDPFVKNMWPQQAGNPFSLVIRGFTTDVQTEDNMRTWAEYNVDIEDKERVEILNGLSDFLYGPADPGGVINYVLKRPTAAPYYSLTLGDYSTGSGYAHLDASGPLNTSGTLAYRINIVGQDGNTGMNFADTRRYLFSAAFDWHITPDILLQLSGSESYRRDEGLPPFWFFASPALHPPALDVSKNWGNPWEYQTNQLTKGEARLFWNINSMFDFRAAYQYTLTTQTSLFSSTNVFDNSGTYTQSFGAFAPDRLQNWVGYAYADAKFDTASIKHTVTVGLQQQYYLSQQPLGGTIFGDFPGVFSFTHPTYVPPPTFTFGPNTLFDLFHLGFRNIIAGDTIRFNDKLSLIAGVAYTTIQEQDNNLFTGTFVSDYKKSAISPSASVIYKPMPWLSTYATYIQGLENGGIAPVGTVNQGQGMPPTVDVQYEVGAKARIGNALVTFALFDINKAYEFINPVTNVYTQQGREAHKGVELGISGKVMDDLTLWGGVTMMQARVVSDASDPTIVGKRPMDASDQMAKLYAEYNIRAVPGLTLTGGVYYTGPFPADPFDQQILPGFVIGDVGARFETTVYNHPTTFRFNVYNVGGTNYWMSSRYLGQPRTFLLSTQMQF